MLTRLSPSPDAQARESKARLDAYEVLFAALAHPARRRVLLAVYFAGGSMTADAIAAADSPAPAAYFECGRSRSP